MPTSFSSRLHLPGAVVPALLISGICLLLISMNLYAVISHERTEEAMHRLLVSKGGVLLNSLESSLRSSRRGNMPRQDFLLEEMAAMGDVLFVAIAGPDGFILAHSNPDRLGEVLRFENRDMTGLDMERLGPDRDIHWLLTHMEDAEAFVLYKRIGHAWIPAGDAPGNSDRPSPAAYDIPLTLFVGLDPAPLSVARAEDAQRNRIMAVGGVCCLLLTLAALYWAAKARRSRQGQKTAEAMTEKMVLSLPDGLVLFDAQGRISHINMIACRWLRHQQPPLGQHAAEALPPELAALVARLLSEASLPDSELELVSDNARIPLSVRGAPVETEDEGRIGSLLLLRDISERKLLEEEIRRREKLAAVASLAAGVAHEIRNPLSSIKGYATYFGQRFAEGSEDRDAARVMVGEVERLNRVITDLIELARPASLRPRPTDLNTLTDDVLRLIRQDAAARDVVIHLDATPLPQLDIDPDRIRQALLNLCLNALDAMPEGGELAVSLKPVKGFAVLETRDTGSGIAPAVLPHIFDPYFTTKSRGTGLGLATVHKIIEAHGGHILTTSAAGKGTSFQIFLPLPPES